MSHVRPGTVRTERLRTSRKTRHPLRAAVQRWQKQEAPASKGASRKWLVVHKKSFLQAIQRGTIPKAAGSHRGTGHCIPGYAWGTIFCGDCISQQPNHPVPGRALIRILRSESAPISRIGGRLSAGIRVPPAGGTFPGVPGSKTADPQDETK